jgi:hypothetical protein
MLTPDRFSSLWGEGRSKADARDPLLGKLSTIDREFVAQCGLPPCQSLLLDFDLALPLRTITWERREYVRIGSDGGTDICVLPESGGVWSVGLGALRFMNSTIPQLAEFLLLVREAERVPSLIAEEQPANLNALIESLKIADPEALSRSRDWWSIVVASWREQL